MVKDVNKVLKDLIKDINGTGKGIDKRVKKTIYLSLFVQFITTLISLDGLNYELNEKDNILKEILILEALVQFVEGFFYVWVILALKDLKIMTPRRYIDWFITTPSMLLSTIIFMKYLEYKENGRCEKMTIINFLKTDWENIKCIGFFNGMMLLFGYLGETNIMNNNKSVIIGFIFFILSFEKIYSEYAIKSELGKKLFKFLLIVWSLYGLAAIQGIITKNIMYNMLDIVAKNFYGLFIYYYISQIGIRK